MSFHIHPKYVLHQGIFSTVTNSQVFTPSSIMDVLTYPSPLTPGVLILLPCLDVTYGSSPHEEICLPVNSGRLDTDVVASGMRTLPVDVALPLWESLPPSPL